MKVYRRRSDEGGQVLIGVIALSMVLIISLAVATTALANAVFTTNQATDHAEAQSAAQSADNWVFAWVNSNAGTLAKQVPAGDQAWLRPQQPAQPTTPLINPAEVQCDLASASQLSPLQPCGSSTLPWWQPQQDGTLVPCAVYNQTCVQVQLRYSSPELLNGDTQVYSGAQTINEEVLVQIRARTMCQSITASKNSGCPTWTYQSLLRRRTFLDYLYFTNYETVEPYLYTSAPPVTVPGEVVGTSADAAVAIDGTPLFNPTPSFSNYCPSTPSFSGCIQPVYGGNDANNVNDNVDGPVHTNSPGIAVCGSPQFTTPFALRLGGKPLVEDKTDTAAQPASGCGSSTSVQTVVTPTVAMPKGDQALQQIAASDTDPVDPTGAACTANGFTQQSSGSCGTVFPSGAVIQGNDTHGVTVTAGGNTYTYATPPPTGVLYVAGDAAVSGQFLGGWTIAASGDITVGTGPSQNKNNLWLHCQGAVPTDAVPSGCPDMVGLVATNDIILNDSNYENASAYPSNAGMAVSAAMMALGGTSDPGICGAIGGTNIPSCGSIYSAQWDMVPPLQPQTHAEAAANITPPPYPAPTLTINGAMVSYYRGLFGVYSTSAPTAGAQAGIDYGMVKHFSYDSRFLSQQPPWFLQPTASSWAIIGFTQTGATRG